MVEFLIANLDFILTAVCALVVCIYLARRGQLAKVREIVLSLCTQAEIEYGGGTGTVKRSSVIEAIYELLPSWAKLFVSATTISRLVEEGKAQMDELAAVNKDIQALINYGWLDDPDGEGAD